MWVRFNIPDDVYDKFLAQSKPKNKETAQAVMRARLLRFAHVDPEERCLVIANEDRKALQAIFQTTIDDIPKLTRLIKNLCYFKIGTVERCFTDGELARLDDQAKFHGWTREKYLDLTSNEAIDFLMERI